MATSSARNKALLAVLLFFGIGDLVVLNVVAAPAYFQPESEAATAPSVASAKPVPTDRTPPKTAAPQLPSAPQVPTTATSVAARVSVEPPPPASAPAATASSTATVAAAVPTPTTASASSQAPVTLVFSRASSALSAETKAVLDEVGRKMKADKSLTVMIKGHADERGTSDFNDWLSRQRADVAARYLYGLGIEPRRIQATGVGMAEPADTSHTEEGLAKNRRVEVLWK